MCQQNGKSYFNVYKGFLEVSMNTEIFQYSFVSLLRLWGSYTATQNDPTKKLLFFTTHSTRSWKIWIWKVNACIPKKHTGVLICATAAGVQSLVSVDSESSDFRLSKMHNPQSYDHNAISSDSASHKAYVPVEAGLSPREKNTTHKTEDKMLVYEAENMVVLCM